jgi:hypothetical protein
MRTPRNSTVSDAIAVILTGAITLLGPASTAHASTPTAPTAAPVT